LSVEVVAAALGVGWEVKENTLREIWFLKALTTNFTVFRDVTKCSLTASTDV